MCIPSINDHPSSSPCVNEMNKLFIETESCVLAQPNYLTENLKARLFLRLLWGFETLFYYTCGELEDWKLWITRNKWIQPVVTTLAEDAVIEATPQTLHHVCQYCQLLSFMDKETRGTGAKTRKTLLKKLMWTLTLRQVSWNWMTF